MTKRSLINPRIKTALSSLDLEIEAEINRYQCQKPSQGPKNSFSRQNMAIIPQNNSYKSEEIDIWHHQVVTTISEQPVTQALAIFKKPLGIASLIITMISSGLLGINLTKPPLKSNLQPPESLVTPTLVEGVNLATEAQELNLKTLSTLTNPQTQLVTEEQRLNNSNRQPQSQLFNQLLLNQTKERNF